MTHAPLGRLIRTAAWGLCAVLAGCLQGGSVAGYRHGELFDEDVRTVAVPIFENRTFHRELQFNLTEALIKELEHETPYRVIRGEGGDTIITGTILSVEQRLLSREFGSGLPQEVQVIVAASFEWTDRRTGEVRRRRGRLEGAGEYVPTRGVSEPFEVARHAAVQALSRRIVATMRSDW